MRISHTLIALLALLLATTPALAQSNDNQPQQGESQTDNQTDTQSEADPALASPRATMMSFLQAMNDARGTPTASVYQRAIQTIDLPSGLKLTPLTVVAGVMSICSPPISGGGCAWPPGGSGMEEESALEESAGGSAVPGGASSPGMVGSGGCCCCCCCCCGTLPS